MTEYTINLPLVSISSESFVVMVIIADCGKMVDMQYRLSFGMIVVFCCLVISV